jgi:acetylglutamate kinase
MMANQIIVVKIGGSTFGSHDTTIKDLVSLQKKGHQIVIVHGGGKTASSWLSKLNIPTRFVNGLRITDKNSLEVVTAVFAGLVNKELVTAIYNAGGSAVGICGSDGKLLWSNMKRHELGFVGEISQVNTKIIKVLLESGYIPVVAPLSLGLDHKQTTLLNVNGDSVAGAIAHALSAERLIFLTDVDGIFGSTGATISKLTSTDARELLNSNVASGGMIPKLQACLQASSVVHCSIITNGTKPNALINALDNKGGTIIESE